MKKTVLLNSLAILLSIAPNCWASSPNNLNMRENIFDFAQDPAKLASLKKAIVTMRSLKTADPTSWSFQSNIHGIDGSNSSDFNQCQHAHWWFLPWHRAYLYYFEKMLQKYSGDPTLRLPYWDYTDPRFRSLPGPFLEKDSPLYVPNRTMDGPDVELRPTQIDTSPAFRSGKFSGDTTSGGFGGGEVPSLIQFPDTFETGLLENCPHNTVHNGVGGLMLDPMTAARDPIFWLHHCNIDRLWEAWNKAGNPNPTGPWSTKTISLYDENGNNIHPAVGVFTDLQNLGYSYDKLPQIQNIHHPSILLASNTGPQDRKAIAEGPGSTIGKDAVTAKLTLKEPAASALLSVKMMSGESHRKYILTLHGIEFDNLPNSTYELYLNQPTATFLTNGQSKAYIGSMAFFEHVADKKKRERVRRFDITNAVQSLMAGGNLKPDDLSVTMVPVGPIIGGVPTQPKEPAPIKVSSFELEVADTALDE